VQSNITQAIDVERGKLVIVSSFLPRESPCYAERGYAAVCRLPAHLSVTSGTVIT